LGHKKKLRKTGGGPKPKDLSPETLKVASIVPTQMESLHNSFDCDSDEGKIVNQ